MTQPAARVLSLDDPVQYAKGVGPVRARALAELGVRTVGDLIEHFPFRHELRPKSIPIGHLDTPGQTATIVGELRRVRSRGPQHKLSVSALVVDGTGELQVRWFNSPFLTDRFHDGMILRVTGRIEVTERGASMANPTTVIIDDDEDPFAGDADRYDPVYSASAQISSRDIRRAIRCILDDAARQVVDFVPESIRLARRFPPRSTAYQRIHFPLAPDDAALARRRLAYDEFLLMQLAVRMRRRSVHAFRAGVVHTTDEIDRRIRARIPFALTPGQETAVAEIRADLALGRPMNRLLQADVGAGKTAVAVYAALTTVANRRQVAILAPTEVLAAQHHDKVQSYLKGSRVRIGYLTGSTPASARGTLLNNLAAGSIDLLIGTHAIIEEGIQFKDLGLVIIDEQHKFGVAQRARLRAKGVAPHALVLTATPIPRSLAMTVFGDLDVSTVRDLPPGRLPVETKLVAPDQAPRTWEEIRARLQGGERAFVVYPLVEESEDSPLKAATEQIERLAGRELAGCRLGLLHGRMRPAEKAEVMERFRGGDVWALVATTVIEVGVDVPEATMMVVEHAERYGLSQLHQLRGRVGRGLRAGTCFLFSDSDAAAATERLQILVQSRDGFHIAEEDMRLRGPGEVLGQRQHGLPNFKVASFAGDLDLLQAARDDAAAILRGDAALSQPEHRPLREALLRRYADTLPLIDVA